MQDIKEHVAETILGVFVKDWNQVEENLDEVPSVAQVEATAALLVDLTLSPGSSKYSSFDLENRAVLKKLWEDGVAAIDNIIASGSVNRWNEAHHASGIGLLKLCLGGLPQSVDTRVGIEDGINAHDGNLLHVRLGH